MKLIIGLLLAGVLEQAFAVLYYRTAQKSLNVSCAVVGFIRGLIWLFMLTSLLKNIDESIFLGLTYLSGGAIGDYISLRWFEPWVVKRILKIKNRGRRKTRWYLKGEKRQ